MGIIDKVGALLPWRGERQQPPPRADVLALRDGLDRWFERFLEEPWPALARGELGWMPPAELRETEDEIVVTLEIPGLDRDDVKLMLTPQGLTVRGEKLEQREDRRRDSRFVEARYGSFVRTIPLPPGLDLDRGEARIRNGVLTVRFPKAAARPGARRIPIKT